MVVTASAPSAHYASLVPRMQGLKVDPPQGSLTTPIVPRMQGFQVLRQTLNTLCEHLLEAHIQDIQYSF